MFNSIKKTNIFDEHLGEFQDNFSSGQKTAMIMGLWAIANSDGEIHQKEEIFMKEMSLILGYDYNNLWDGVLNSQYEPGEIKRALNSLTNSGKDWYIITIFGMIHADGRTLEVEFAAAEAILNLMNVSVDHALKTLQKSQALMDHFNF
jgi:uncharacterized tellurite resistance protein B-like protein